jgi:hypothetical protein
MRGEAIGKNILKMIRAAAPAAVADHAEVHEAEHPANAEHPAIAAQLAKAEQPIGEDRPAVAAEGFDDLPHHVVSLPRCSSLPETIYI